eukprot:gene18373-biopygen15975
MPHHITAPSPGGISSKRRRLRPRGGGGPTGSLDTPQCRRGPKMPREHIAPAGSRSGIAPAPAGAGAAAAVGLGLHPAALPRPRARCSRFGGGWRRLAGVAKPVLSSRVPGCAACAHSHQVVRRDGGLGVILREKKRCKLWGKGTPELGGRTPGKPGVDRKTRGVS